MSIVDQLKESALFKGVKPDDLEALVQVMKSQSFPAGHVLFEKGDVGDAMYIVLSGRVRIYTQDKYGNEITLSYQEPTRIFGDYALLDQQPRSASAIADGPIAVLALYREDFLTFLPKHPSVGLAMMRNLADQVRHITTFMSKVNDALERLALGEYEQVIQEISSSGTDAEIQDLTKALLQMVHSVREREEKLKLNPNKPA